MRNGLIALFDGRPKLQDDIARLLGREPHPTGAGREIWHISRGAMEFEWHPRTRRVYWIRKKMVGTAVQPIGEVVAFDIETHGDAINAVNIFLRGWECRAGEQKQLQI